MSRWCRRAEVEGIVLAGFRHVPLKSGNAGTVADGIVLKPLAVPGKAGGRLPHGGTACGEFGPVEK